tara:strand:- start:124 stop:246 length:123 start_codon:yes stop_codon:yes gene_type:complete
MDKTIGSIKKGKIANFLMLDKNSLENIRNSQRINKVMLEG